MKEILEAFSSRIKSPVFGYFALVWLALNWGPVFELLFNDNSASERVETFKSQTNYFYLFILPFIVGAIISLVYPWVNYYFLKLCQKPTDLKNKLQAESEHSILLQKIEYENKRQEIVVRKETDLIDQAKRDQEIQSIENDELRKKLETQIDELRAEFINRDTPPLTHAQLLDKSNNSQDASVSELTRLAQDLENAGMHEESRELLYKLAQRHK